MWDAVYLGQNYLVRPLLERISLFFILCLWLSMYQSFSGKLKTWSKDGLRNTFISSLWSGLIQVSPRARNKDHMISDRSTTVKRSDEVGRDVTRHFGAWRVKDTGDL